MVRTFLTSIIFCFAVLSSATIAHAQNVYPTLLPILNYSPSNNQPSIGGAKIDLIVEADTYVPYFYRGRREPTAGSKLRLIAITDSSVKPTSYQWQVAGQSFTTTNQVLETVLPEISNEFVIIVKALGIDGKQLGSATSYIRASKPQILFYESNQLRGASSLAVGENLPFIGQEVVVRAEPYFLATNSVFSESTGQWSVDSGISLEESSDWRRVTLVKNGTSTNLSEAKVNLSVINLNNPAYTLNGTFKLGL